MSSCWLDCWKCDECGHRWIKTEVWPERCASSKCRKRSWNHDGGSSKRPEPESVTGRNAQKDASYGAGDASAASVTAMGDSQPRPTMQSLRDICAGKIPLTEDPRAIPGRIDLRPIDASRFIVAGTEIPICGKTWWEDGEQYECLMDAGHKAIKHGQHGMVRRLDQ